MTVEERVAYIRRQVPDMPELTDAVIEDKLMEAADAVYHQRYPFGGGDIFDTTEGYELTVLRLAIRYINRGGVEGEIAHSENGVNRQYANTEEEDLLSKIIPCARLVK